MKRCYATYPSISGVSCNRAIALSTLLACEVFEVSSLFFLPSSTTGIVIARTNTTTTATPINNALRFMSRDEMSLMQIREKLTAATQRHVNLSIDQSINQSINQSTYSILTYADHPFQFPVPFTLSGPFSEFSSDWSSQGDGLSKTFYRLISFSAIERVFWKRRTQEPWETIQRQLRPRRADSGGYSFSWWVSTWRLWFIALYVCCVSIDMRKPPPKSAAV